jgi:hypothetical protein
VIRITVPQEIDYEKDDIDIIKYNHGIVIGPLLFTYPEEVAAGIYTGCVSIRQICK